VLWSRRSGDIAGDDPWHGAGLEWRTASPVPRYNFLRLPTVRDRYANWTSPPDQAVVVGLDPRRREALVTRTLDAEPDHRTEEPGPTIAPLLLALATGVAFIGAIFNPWWFVAGGVLALPPALWWFWPHGARPAEGAR
jgi:cytochrome c oxidase subunit I+III